MLNDYRAVGKDGSGNRGTATLASKTKCFDLVSRFWRSGLGRYVPRRLPRDPVGAKAPGRQLTGGLCRAGLELVNVWFADRSGRSLRLRENPLRLLHRRRGGREAKVRCSMVESHRGAVKRNSLRLGHVTCLGGS